MKPVQVQPKLAKAIRKTARIFGKRVLSFKAGKKIMKRSFLVATILLLLTCHAYSASEPTPQDNYHCKDQSSWQEWHALLEKHPDDDSVYTLYALRLCLCSMVEADNIDKDRAVRIFENMRGAVIRQYKEGELTEKEKGEGI